MKEKNGAVKRNRKVIIIAFIIIIIIMAPVLLFGKLTNHVVEEITQTISLQYSRELNAQMSEHISGTIDDCFHELGIEYNVLTLIDGLNEEKLRRFIVSTEAENGITYLAFADEEGYIYEAEHTYLGTLRVPMLGELLGGAERVVADNETVENENYILFGVSFDEPIQMGTHKLCVALLGMNNTDLSGRVSLHSEHSGGYSSIINADGSYVVKNAAEPYGGLNAFSILEKNGRITEDELSRIKEKIGNKELYMTSAGDIGSEDYAYLYFAPIEGTDWYVINTLPGSFIKTTVTHLSNTLMTTYIALVVFLFVIGLAVIYQQASSARKLKKSKAETEDALKLAEQASSAKTAFLFNMSHDIRTPMNAILGYTDIGLRHTADTQVSEDSFRKIKMSGTHLLNLINDVLEMSRIESGKMKLDEKPLDIRRAISDVTEMSRSLAIAKSLNFETAVGDIQNPYIYADELHINEVLINLISNSVKYTPEGTVRFSVSQISEVADGRAFYRFEVADTGVGMSEEFQEHLFESFSREENTTVSKIEGTGLGLAIVKKIVDMAEGTIRVKSVQGEGSLFTVEFPFRVMDEKEVQSLTLEKEQETKQIEDFDFEGKKVLLAEDNELNREIAVYILENAGLEVETAEDGDLALKAVMERGTEYYDFILMDIQMPVMDGYGATRAIRALSGGESIPIIALSANAFEEDKKKSIAEGMNAHVAKPIDIKELLEVMQSMAKRQRE